MGWNGGEIEELEEAGYRLSGGQVTAVVLGYLEGPAGVGAGPAQVSPRPWSASCPGLILIHPLFHQAPRCQPHLPGPGKEL